MGKKFSDLERASSLNNGDLFAVAQVDAQAQTGYKSKSTETSTVAQKLLKGIEFSTDLQTDDKTVLGAINEVNSRTIAYDVVSGPIANFKTSLELPIKSLEIDVNAVQSAGTPTPASPLPISGWSQVEVYQRGVNLWNENTEIGGLNDTTGQPTSDNNRLRSADYCPIKENETVYVKKGGLGNINLFFYDASKTFLSKTDWVSGNATRNIPSGAYYFKIVLATQYGTTYNHDISINYPSSDTTYHAYNPNGNTEVINLGGTYYGGHFTQDKDGHRQFVVDRKLKTVDGSVGVTVASSSYIKSDACDGYINDDEIQPRVSAEYQPDLLCNRLTQAKGNIWSNVGHADEFCINNRSIHFNISNASLGIVDYTQETTETAKAKIDAFLQNNPVVVVIPITPYVIDLPDGEPIITLNGTNNIYADSGDASVEYALTVEEYINKKIAEVQALILNS